MGILQWVQGKLSGKQEKKRFDVGAASGRRTSASNDRQEEFSDWPQALLAIGTFGNNEIKENMQRNDAGESSHSSQDFPDFSIEEVTKLQKELTKLLTLKPKVSTDGLGEGANLPLNRFLNCPSSLEVDRKAAFHKSCEDLENNDSGGDLSPDSKAILKKAKDTLADSRNVIKQRSISFLLKKMFVCRSGFAPAPTFRDTIPESKMEKLLRMILHKKMNPQNSSPTSVNKYLEKKPMETKHESKKIEEKEEDGSKWVKTDSEYIVLEL